MNKRRIIPIFVPHLGCPHECVFCNQRKITNFDSDISYPDIIQTIERYLGYFQDNSFVELAFYGGSFTAINFEIQENLLKIAKEYKDNGLISEIRLSTRPDAINDEILEYLSLYGVDTIELGVQSLYNDVLMASGRGHLAEDVHVASQLIKDKGFNLGLQMMVGLPGDTIEKSLVTALEFIKLEPDCVRIYPTLVIKDTFLEKLTYLKKYSPLTLETAIEISSQIMILFYLNNINVIRVGLQPTENIQLGKDVVAGPFHPAFRQLAESHIYRLIFECFFEEIVLKSNVIHMEIIARDKDISNLSGQNSINLFYLKQKYNLNKISFNKSSLGEDKFYVVLGLDKYEINKNVYMKKIFLDFCQRENLMNLYSSLY